MSLGTWGDTVFEVTRDRVRTWQEMKRSGEARWVEHEVLGTRPRPEFIGPGLDTLTLSVKLDVRYGVNPTEELKALREKRDTGVVDSLIIGGETIFDCSLRSIGEEHKRHDAKGVLQLVIVDLTFKEDA